MKIDLTEMMKIKGRLADINTEMGSTFNSINTEFEYISSNINSDGLNQAIVKLQGNITSLSKNFAQNMGVLEEFIENQLSSYTNTNEEVGQTLQNLVNSINATFDQEGNVIRSASAAAALTAAEPVLPEEVTTPPQTSTRRADPTIGDSSGYNAGEGLQNRFSTKIGNSDAKWEIVDQTYYYFKDKGLSDEQIAGIIGNMTQESALDLRCPTGQYQGLFQWGRDRYPSGWDIQTQLDHAWQEIEYDRWNGKVLSNLSATTTVADATSKFAYWFEGCTSEMKERTEFANAVYYYIKNNL